LNRDSRDSRNAFPFDFRRFFEYDNSVQSEQGFMIMAKAKKAVAKKKPAAKKAAKKK
jgi:hypothetical protein